MVRCLRRIALATCIVVILLALAGSFYDPGPMPRTSLQIAKELHALLKNTDQMPPYVLVGHSFGGYNVRVFNGLYPDCKKTNTHCFQRRGA